MEEPTGTGQPATAPEPQTGQSAAPPETPVVPDKFQGKSAQEIAQAYSELEKRLGSQSEEVGQLRDKLSYMQGMVEQGFQRPQAQEATPPPGPKWNIDPDAFFQKPVDNVDMIVQQRIKEYEERQQAENKRRDEEEAKSNYQEGMDMAYRQNKRLYEGIEQATANLVYESYRRGAINKSSLRNPKTWEMCAKNIWLAKDDLSRLVSPSLRPVTATQTESPQAGKPQSFEEAPPEVDEETRRFWKEQGLSEKEGMEVMRKEMEAVATKKNWSRRY